MGVHFFQFYIMPQNYIKYNSENLDRRIKLDLEKKAEIRKLRADSNLSLQRIADMFCVSKKTIHLTVNEEAYKKNQEYRKGKWKKYYEKDSHKKYIAKYRARKRTLGFVR